MGVKVAAACLHWAQSPVPHPPSSPQTLVSTVSSPSLKRRSFSDGALVFRYIQKLDPSTLFGSTLHRSKSTDHPKPRAKTITRAYSENLDAFSDEEFSKQLQELAMKFQLSGEEDDDDDESSSSDNSTNSATAESKMFSDSVTLTHELDRKIDFSPFEPLQPPEWSAREDIIPASMERKANSVDIPFSLRIIKSKKKQLQQGFAEAGDSACSSVKKAFSSMVFIIHELHSFTLQMREMLFYEDLQGILTRVQTEIHASFVWLFQQVFSHTPQLMISVMILLANYSVYSMSNATALAAPAPPLLQSYAAMTDSISYENHVDKHAKFDSSTIKTFSVNGKTASIDGNNGGGGKFRRTASGTEGDGRFEETTSLNCGAKSTGDSVAAREEESVSGQAAREDEMRVWNSIVEEAARMQGEVRDEALDHETVQRFVSPVTAKIEGDDDYADYFRTELVYQMGLAQDPENCVLLANYAQFLYLVARDFDRAEGYFKRAVKVEPPDAEALSKYAGFLWQARNDQWAAEQTYLEAISAEPTNSYYAANYAHFLWNTGGEDTCFPIDNTTDA